MINSTINDKTFDRVLTEQFELEPESKAILKFGTKWCGPCKILDASLKAAPEIPNYKIYLIDVEESPELGVLFDVQMVPTVIVLDKSFIDSEFNNTKIIKRIYGSGITIEEITK